jgi:hypothetical protein
MRAERHCCCTEVSSWFGDPDRLGLGVLFWLPALRRTTAVYALQMSIDDARRRLGDRPSLQRAVADRWLTLQAALPSDGFHPLYALLEWAGADPGVEAFLDGLERAVDAPIGGALASRIRRLTAGTAPSFDEYWSAVDELSFTSRLSDCDLAVRFGDASRGELDIVVSDDDEDLHIEMTARHQTRELEALQAMLTGRLADPFVIRLRVGRQTYRPVANEREEIARRVQNAVDGRPRVPTDVGITDLVDRRTLQIDVEPAGIPYVVTETTDLLGHYDPIPDVEDAIERKRRQLRPHEAVVVGVNVDSVSADVHAWALRRALESSGGTTPSIVVPANVVGAIAFLRQAPREPPMLAIWLPNRASTSAGSPLLNAVLACLHTR